MSQWVLYIDESGIFDEGQGSTSGSFVGGVLVNVSGWVALPSLRFSGGPPEPGWVREQQLEWRQARRGP